TSRQGRRRPVGHHPRCGCRRARRPGAAHDRRTADGLSRTLRLALRDLRGGLKGLGLLWLCLAVAIAGLASVTSLASSVDSAIAANGRALLGGDLMLSVAQRDATADERAAIDALGRVSKSVTTRSMLIGSDGRSQLVELSGVDRNWRLAGEVDWGV